VNSRERESYARRNAIRTSLKLILCYLQLSTLLGGSEETAKTQNSNLCLKCQGIFIRPNNDWKESIRNQPCYMKRAVVDVVSSATNGCIICAILWDSILSTRKSRHWIEDDSEFVSCMLHWNAESGKFDGLHFHHNVQVHFDLLSDEGKFILANSPPRFSYSNNYTWYRCQLFSTWR
jgi:hypothetical protein